MLTTCTIWLSDTAVLNIWPFSAEDLRNFIRKLPMTNAGFAAVNHEDWQDGLHYPESKMIGAKKVGCGMLGKVEKARLLQTKDVESIINLQLYVPRKEVHPKELKRLESVFCQRRFGDALNRWGGILIEVHDMCKVRLSFESSQVAQEGLTDILQSGGMRINQKHRKLIWKRASTVPARKCLFLACFEDVIRFRVLDGECQMFETYDSLLPPE